MLPLIALWLSFVAHTLAGLSCYTLELTWGTGSPDGFEREMIFINGQFPGPLLEFQQGDEVEVTVVNKMPFNTTIHYHGIEQINTPWADGVPGLSQRPIQPGANYTSKWYADQYGSYFYHAHSRGQIDDGCYGPITIKPKDGLPKPFDQVTGADAASLEAAEAKVTPLILSDWRHTPSEQIWQLQLESGVEAAICVDSVLVNGKGAVSCWPRDQITQFTKPGIAPLLKQNGNLQMTDKGCLPPQMLPYLYGNATTNIGVLPPEIFEVCTPTNGSVEIIKVSKSDQWKALDVISTAGIDTFVFSIDEHPLWVYAVDGHYINPMKVDALTVANGDRYSVFIQLDKPGGNYGIRASDLALSQLIDTTAILAYDGGYAPYGNHTSDDVHTVTSTPYTNQAGSATSQSVTFFNQSQMVSFPPQFPQPAPEVDQTFIMTLKTVNNSYSWVLNGTQFNHAIDDSNPPLLYQDPNVNNPGGDITITTKNNTWVDLVFKVVTQYQPPHPIHKHSNKGFVIGQGQGDFTWNTVAEAAAAVPQNFNLATPAYRDAFLTPATITNHAWLAVRYHVVNPGAFMLHCHIQSHLNGGMAMVILDGTDEWPEVPSQYQN